MEEFVDFYELLQISPNAEAPTIQRVYRLLAARYHPDNPETGDLNKFVQLQKAYETLSDFDQRAAYDQRWQGERVQPMPVFEAKEFVVGIDVEVNRRLGLLCLLYNQRRSSPENPSVPLLEMESRMAIPREHLEFTIWYLRDKDLVRRDERTSEIYITATGVDFVEQSQPSNRIVTKLLKPAESGSQQWVTDQPVDLKSKATPQDVPRS